MTTHRTRRTFRSAGLVALAAAAAFSLTACQDGDTDAAATGKDPVSASRSADDGASSGAKNSEGSEGKGQKGTETEASSASRDSTPSGAGEAASPARTEKLADGSTAEISELGEQRYRAKIVNDGDVLATLETKGHDAGLDANGMYVLLSLDGKIHSWMGGEHTGPGTFSLEGGWKAKVTKLSDGRFRARILGEDGSVMATLNANQRDVGVDANGVPIVLSSRGVISSHA
ncbi:hypothetical protein [Streptomyces iconiensis]|uniref:Lipoprotein n=1 Tax=Streptomyces iconiensis TaxID=1384038 RepID=A0ABT6ZUX8_9ACTN|nr:hypothetical protein [Streptomyces iconiensis]MDJ1132657.1 hypothetical protein [Streptomyces iconiensis]